jgi:hypothetical protein
VVGFSDPCGRVPGFQDRSSWFFFQAAPQLCSRGWLDPVPDPLLLGESGGAGGLARTSGSAAGNSDRWITEAVYFLLHNIYKFSSFLTSLVKSPKLGSTPRHTD